MPRFRHIETYELIDKLAQHTRTLAELFLDKDFGTEYHKQKKIVSDLQMEIKSRKQKRAQAPASKRSQSWFY